MHTSNLYSSQICVFFLVVKFLLCSLLHWIIRELFFLCWQEDLPCPDDLDELGLLFGEVTPLDCPTPSSSRLTHPPSTLLSSSFARCADLFNHASPSGTTSRATLDPPVITLDDQDDN